MSSGAPRILLYSHDSYGLGHFRRSMTLAETIVEDVPSASVLLATGSPCATHFAPPSGVDVLKLPCVSKDAAGTYVPRSLPGPLSDTLSLRGDLLLAAYRSFRPDLVVVDHQVTGLHDELIGVLHEADGDGVRTMLGLRDVIDGPDVVQRQFSRPETRRALVELYDAICVYGTPRLFDHRVEYALPDDVADRLEFVGYVVRPRPRVPVAPLPAERPQVLVTVGGGEDGCSRLSTYLEALALGPATWDTVILLGPLLEREASRHLRQEARAHRGVRVHDFRGNVPRLLEEADAVVCMAGYNTTAEVLQSGAPAVLLPRSRPRMEQAIRAARLERLGLAHALERPTAETLRSALERALSLRRRPQDILPLDGARRAVRVVRRLLGLPVCALPEESLVA